MSRPGHRIVPVRSWVIWYREQESGVLILRVLHGHMDADRHLLL
jgi:plasmid stabilization system protein ParE